MTKTGGKNVGNAQPGGEGWDEGEREFQLNRIRLGAAGLRQSSGAASNAGFFFAVRPCLVAVPRLRCLPFPCALAGPRDNLNLLAADGD